jgi:hypothetical protein
LGCGGGLGGEAGGAPGTGQGVVATWSAPASAFGPPLIGVLYGLQGSFALAFGLVAAIAVAAVWAAGRQPARHTYRGALRPMSA